MFRVRVSVWDAAVAVSCFLIAVLLLLLPLLHAKSGANLLVTSPKGEVSYPLDTPRTLTVEGNGHTLTVEIRDGAAEVTASDCPDGICLASPSISRHGQSILCAPAGIRLLITDGRGGSNDTDFVAG